MFGFQQRRLLRNVTRINYGCGTNLLEGYLNIDCDRHRGALRHDATQPLPLADESVEAIFSEHMIEHLALPDVLTFLAECHRLLRRDAPIRIATPDLARFVGFLSSSDQEELENYTKFIAGRHPEIPASLLEPQLFLNQIMSGHGHKCVFDFAFLSEVLSHCGFTDITREKVYESRIPCFRGIEGHGKVIGDDINEIETLVVEAWKRS